MNARPGTFAARYRRRAVAVAFAIVAALALVLVYGTYRFIPSRSTQVAGDLVQRVNTDERVVALTFDDGPTNADADAVLKVLADRGVPATFYIEGQAVEDNETTVRRIIEEGHEVGNHTWSHRRMVFVSPGTVADEIESTDSVIRNAGYDGPLTFRPPYGNKLLTLPLYLAEHDRLTVTWDVSAEDFSGTPQTSSDIIEGTVTTTRPGSIILLHPWFGRTTTQQSIGPVIDQLQAQGYRFVTITELVG